MVIDKEYLNLLDRRIERLTEEINVSAPKIIIKNELNLIKDLIEKMLSQLEDKK